jgi:hypothetical protein
MSDCWPTIKEEIRQSPWLVSRPWIKRPQRKPTDLTATPETSSEPTHPVAQDQVEVSR